MKFIDLVKLKIKAGDGGNGIISFRRELYVSKGGPNGGDGGKGGSIIFIGDEGLNTLLDLRGKQEIKAEPGVNGKPKDMHGKKGKNTYIKVPIGTIIKNIATQELMGDIISHGQEIIIAKGGVGGRGNARFVSPTNRVPRICENGAKGESFEIICELKLLANAGLIGLPNAGKSTFLRSVSDATPEVADYPFTTLQPHLGVVKVQDKTFVMADLPGLIAGASDGKGLGHQFLRHIERCQVLVHLVDISNEKQEHLLIYNLIREELGKYNPLILEKPQIIVANKIDALTNNDVLKQFAIAVNQKVFAISALNKVSLNPLLEMIASEVIKTKSNIKEEQEKPEEHVLYKYEASKSSAIDITVTKKDNNTWEVAGKTVEKIHQRNPLNTHQNILLFEIKLKDLGVFETLRKLGVKKGDRVFIFDYEMQWETND